MTKKKKEITVEELQKAMAIEIRPAEELKKKTCSVPRTI